MMHRHWRQLQPLQKESVLARFSSLLRTKAKGEQEQGLDARATPPVPLPLALIHERQFAPSTQMLRIRVG